MKIAANAKCENWGSDKNARRVSFLTSEEREAILNGEEIFFEGAPEYLGETRRRIVEISGRFYCRMP